MRGNVHVRFGGRGQEDLPLKSRKASYPRPHICPCPQKTPPPSSKSYPADI